MNNFSVTVTEILGTDSMNNSRVTINNNFRTLATAINNISNLVSSDQIGETTVDFLGKRATIGGVTISNNAIQIGSSSLDGNTLAALIELLNYQGTTGAQGSQGTQDLTDIQGDMGTQGT